MIGPSRLRAADLLSVGTVGLRSRRLRAGLSALGVSIGIAALVGVLGITRSSQSDLLAQLDQLGTNLLTVVNGRDLSGTEAELPAPAAGMISRVAGVQHVAATAQLNTAHVYKKTIVTTLEDGRTFYPAEAYHQDYFRKHPNQGYCAVVIAPKIKKLEKELAAEKR